MMTVTFHTALVIQMRMMMMMMKVSVVTGGTASGSPCAFPFHYQGKEYRECTTENHNNLWCSTTTDYEGKWRQCESASSWNVSHFSQSICALEGSTVNMSCSYTYPSHLTVKEVYWINSLTDEASDISQLSQYKDRVSVNCSDKHCSLRINSVKLSDEGHYYCRVTTNVRKETRTGKPGVKISVAVLKVSSPGGPVQKGDHVTLTCETTGSFRSGPSFMWSKDGRPVEKKQIINNQLQLHPVSREDGGNYTCAVKGYEDLPSSSERLSVMYPPQNMQIQISPSGKITEGSHVTLTCKSEADPPVHTYTWIKKSGAVELKSGKNILTFTKIRSENSGEYLCRAINVIGQQDSPLVTVQVLYPPQNTKVLISYSGVTTKGSLVTLTCSSDANPPVESYTWFKVNGSTPVGSGQKYSITNIRPEDGEHYYCEARNEYGAENSSAVSKDEGEQSPVMVTMVAVSVSVCGVLGLVCAAVWMRHHCKGGRAQRENRDGDVNYGNDTTEGQSGTSSVYQSLNLKLAQPDAIYQSLNPNTIQPGAVYNSLRN